MDLDRLGKKQRENISNRFPNTSLYKIIAILDQYLALSRKLYKRHYHSYNGRLVCDLYNDFMSTPLFDVKYIRTVQEAKY